MTVQNCITKAAHNLGVTLEEHTPTAVTGLISKIKHGDQMTEKGPYKYDVQGVMTLSHLPDTVLTVSQMSGGAVTGTQYFINTTYLIAENMRNGQSDAGLRRSRGFSIDKNDLDSLIETLQNIRDGKCGHYFVCATCTGGKSKIVLHHKQNADDQEVCPKSTEQSSGSSFVVE